MITVAEAQTLVLQHAQPLASSVTPLGPSLLGLVLAEHVASDLDMPPWDKALMDGYAVRSSDLASGEATLTVIEEVSAGGTPTQAVRDGQACRIMTGAPMPAGADAVVMVERTRQLDATHVQISDKPAQSGQNILYRGREMRCGEVVLEPGIVLRPQELGLLASVGRTMVRVQPRPEVAVLTTGDEIVEPRETPGPGQIRNSNGTMIAGLVERSGGRAVYLGIARDNREHLRSLVERGLENPVLVLSGGVSAGQKDLVPGVLEDLGVQACFHKVLMKPGKPVFFGVRERTLVFGLPGNPVSSLACFELFVRPALCRLLGHARPGPNLVQAELLEPFRYRTDRPTYHPVRLESGSTGWQVRPVPWFGSPDLRGITRSNAFAVLDKGEHDYPAGQRLSVLRTEY